MGLLFLIKHWMTKFDPDEIKFKDMLSYAMISTPSKTTKKIISIKKVINLIMSKFQIIENTKRSCPQRYLEQSYKT